MRTSLKFLEVLIGELNNQNFLIYLISVFFIFILTLVSVVIGVFVLLITLYILCILPILLFVFILGSLYSVFEFIDKYKEIKDFNKNSISFLKKYGTLWLGISSKNDEAIQGLKFTLSKKFKEVNVLNNFNKNIRFTIQNLLIMFISKTIKIPLNSGIKRLLQNFAHGNDIPTAFLENLSVSPLKNHVDCPLIPDKIDKEILELANKTLAASVPDLRNKLNLLGSDINPLILTDEFLGSGLVHIGYFENEKIWEILSLNIKIAFNELDESLGDSKEELIEWINNFKQTISNALNKIDVV